MHAGYHYTRAQLDQFSDPDEAHARRGAYWTFDGIAFVSKMQELHAKGKCLLCITSTFLPFLHSTKPRQQNNRCNAIEARRVQCAHTDSTL